MAQATAGTTLQTDLVGQREQLANMIIRTEPEKTPVVSQMGREKFTSVLSEYMRDDLAAPDDENAEFDGFEVDIQAGDQPVRLAAIPQIFTKNLRVSGRADVVNKAGRGRERARLGAKRLIEMRRDIEKRAVGIKPAVVGTPTVKPKSASIGIHLYTTSTTGATGLVPSHTSGAPVTAMTAGTARPFTNDLIEDGMEGAHNEAGEVPNQLYMSSFHKRIFSTFTGLSHMRESTGNEKTINNNAEIYMSNFGKLMVRSHYMMKDYTHVLALRMEHNKLGWLRGLRTKELPANGDYTATLMIMDCGICVKSEKGQFGLFDLENS